MKKRILTLVLSVVMVVTMSVPAFADTSVVLDAFKPVYVVMGDSVAAGWNSYNTALSYNSSDLYNQIVRPQGRIKNAVYNGEVYDSTKIDFIKGAFPTYVKNALPNGINEKYSFNFTYPGMRAMEFCYFFGLLSKKEITALQQDNFCFMNYTDEDGFYVKDDLMIETAKTVKKSIKKASIINIELGVNDLNAALQGDTEQLIAPIASLLEKHFGLSMNSLFAANNEGSDVVSAEDATTLKMIEKNIAILQSTDASTRDKLQALMNILCGIRKMGIDTVKAVADIDKVFVNRSNQNRKYTNRLLAYIRLLNPKAHIILLNLYNPLKGMLGGADVDLGGMNASVIEDVASLIVKPSVLRINSNIRNAALKYDCTVADVSKIVPGRMDEWQCHPTADGQKEIGKIVMKALKKDCLKRSDELGAILLAASDCKASKKVCKHENTVLYNVKEANVFEKGYSGDTCCTDCGAVVANGEETPRQPLTGTTIRTLIGKSHTITVKWDKVADVDRYVIQYSTSAKFKTNKHMLIVPDATKGRRTIKNLKSGTKYYIRIRTTKSADGKKVHSAWSKKESITLK